MSYDLSATALLLLVSAIVFFLFAREQIKDSNYSNGIRILYKFVLAFSVIFAVASVTILAFTITAHTAFIAEIFKTIIDFTVRYFFEILTVLMVSFLWFAIWCFAIGDRYSLAGNISLCMTVLIFESGAVLAMVYLDLVLWKCL